MYSGSRVSKSGTFGSEILSIATTSPVALTTVYICATSNFDDKVSSSISFQVCGTEVVSLSSSSDALTQTYDEGAGDKKILFTSFSHLFEVDSTICPIVTYEIVEKQGSLYTLYSLTDIVLDASKNVIIKTSKAMTKSLYIRASSEASMATRAYLPLSVTVNAAESENSLANLIN